MENNITEIKDFLPIASPLIKSLVDTYITPKLEDFKKNLTIRIDKDFFPNDDNFTEYFHRTYKKVAIVNTLVFNNSQRLLSDIYIPLTISSNNHNEKESVKIVNFPIKLIDKYGYLLITDTAGMGKSTIMKKFFMDIFSSNTGIPIFIELRRLSKTKSIISEIQEQLNSINKEFDSNLFLSLINEGGFIFLLDGYDEISLSDREIVTKDIQDFISKLSNNKFIITSRPEKALSSFGNFKEFKIEPLSKKEAFELLRKYDKQGSISTLLIKKLQESEFSSIDEFLTNPLLVSLLFTAFEHKQSIPFKKHLFYRQVYDANFENHDLTKGESYIHKKYSNLELDDFHRVLRHIGFSCVKIQKIEFIKEEILKLINESKRFCVGLEFRESDFLQDLVKTVPIFSQDGNYFRWSHKSLQEYFAAQFVYHDSKEEQASLLSKMYNSKNVEKYYNIFDIYYDIDYKAFRNVIEYELLLDFEKQINSFRKNFSSEVFSEILINERFELTFYCEYIALKINKREDLGSQFQRIVANHIEKYKSTNYTNPYGKFGGKSDNMFYVIFKDSRLSILEILFNKKNNIVQQISEKELDEYDFGINHSLEELLIENNQKEEYNSIQNFGKTTKQLRKIRNGGLIINYKKAIIRLEEIKEDIENNDLKGISNNL